MHATFAANFPPLDAPLAAASITKKEERKRGRRKKETGGEEEAEREKRTDQIRGMERNEHWKQHVTQGNRKRGVYGETKSAGSDGERLTVCMHSLCAKAQRVVAVIGSIVIIMIILFVWYWMYCDISV